jgi:hypothetical protein
MSNFICVKKRDGSKLRQQEFESSLKYRGQSILRFDALCDKRLEKRGPLVFANGGPNSGHWRGDAGGHPLPK